MNEKWDLLLRSNSMLTWSMWPWIRLSKIKETNSCSTSFSGTLSSWKWNWVYIQFQMKQTEARSKQSPKWERHTDDVRCQQQRDESGRSCIQNLYQNPLKSCSRKSTRIPRKLENCQRHIQTSESYLIKSTLANL